MATRRWWIRGMVLGVIWLASAGAGSSAVYADIYMYRDAGGVLHFTNVPASPKYQIFLRERISARPSYDASRYDHLIDRASRHHGIAAPLIKAVIKAESNFNPNAVSKKGALGLMQIMPFNLRLLKVSDPFDPWENIMGGAQYLKAMLQRFDGQLRLALAAYNAGPESVDKYQEIPPYPETVQYVRRVLDFYEVFKKS